MDWDWTHLHFVVVCNKIRQPFLEIRAEREGEGACMDNDEIHIEGERRGERERERERCEWWKWNIGIHSKEARVLRWFLQGNPSSHCLLLSPPLSLSPFEYLASFLVLHMTPPPPSSFYSSHPLFACISLLCFIYIYTSFHMWYVMFMMDPIEFEVSCLLENKIIFCW